MSEKFLTIKEVGLKNNCPECFSTDGLQLTFKQRFKETAFFKSLTQEMAHEITCKTCNTTIYPVQWTDDIERVVDYQKRAFEPKKSSLKLKKASWIVLILAAVLLVAAITLFILKGRF